MTRPAPTTLTPAKPTPGAGSGAGLAAVLGALVVFSWGFPIVKLVPLPPATIAFWRLLIGVVFLVAVAALRRAPWPRQAWPMIGAGVCFGVHQILFVAATQRTSIAIVTLLGALQPLLVALASRRTVGEPVPRALVGWSAVAVAGVAVVVQANLGDPSRSLIGDVLAVINLLAFTAYFLFAKRGREQGAPTVTFTAGAFAVSMVVVLPGMLLSGAALPAAPVEWWLIALVALVPGNGHLLVNWAHVRVSAALASLVLAGIPLLSSIWARLLFDEPYGWRHVAGMLMVAAAIEGGRRVERGVRIRSAARTPSPTPGRSAAG